MSETLLGAIIGGSVALLGSIITGILSQIVQYKSRVRSENRELLVKCCIEAKELLFLLRENASKISDELVVSVKVKLSIFGSKKLLQGFTDVVNAIDSCSGNSEEIDMHYNHFNELVKQELHLR